MCASRPNKEDNSTPSWQVLGHPLRGRIPAVSPFCLVCSARSTGRSSPGTMRDSPLTRRPGPGSSNNYNSQSAQVAHGWAQPKPHDPGGARGPRGSRQLKTDSSTLSPEATVSRARLYFVLASAHCSILQEAGSMSRQCSAGHPATGALNGRASMSDPWAWPGRGCVLRVVLTHPAVSWAHQAWAGFCVAWPVGRPPLAGPFITSHS